ncbi:acryloyl-CoA reductase (NADH) [Peptococcaceae bacterium CEB3]|nr:acryloyl-CoA reductase (NADH) [Peptococcaceae bacterium CEB3]
MNYDLSDEQNMLKRGSRKFLAKECTGRFVREMAVDEKGFTEELWQKMADLDWMGIAIPDQYGGSGGNFLDLVVLLSEMGYSLLPGPFFSAVVLGGFAVVEAGDEKQKKTILPDLALGKKFMTMAWMEEEGRCFPADIKLSARKENGNYVLSGSKLFVADAHVSDIIICAARTAEASEDPCSGISLFLVDAGSPGINLYPLDTMAGDKQFEVVFNRVEVSASKLLGESGGGWRILEKVILMAATAKCAEMSGGAERVMDLVLKHVNQRVQFGRPIGSFQAVQHHCADMLIYLDTLKFMTFQAAWKIANGSDFAQEASMCKALAGEYYRKLIALAHQVMGGVGFMEEFDLQLYFKRAAHAEAMFGDGDFHRELVAQIMGL